RRFTIEPWVHSLRRRRALIAAGSRDRPHVCIAVGPRQRAVIAPGIAGRFIIKAGPLQRGLDAGGIRLLQVGAHALAWPALHASIGKRQRKEAVGRPTTDFFTPDAEERVMNPDV